MVGGGRACRCAACGGVWIPFGSVDRVVPRLGELAGGERSPEAAARRPASKYKCPECGGDLVRVRSGAVRGGSLCTCLVCFGRWVDGEALAGMARRGFWGWLGRLFRPPAPPPLSGDPGAAEPPAGRPGEESARTETSSTDGEGQSR